MHLKDWGAIGGLFTAFFGGCIWIYKKLVKPAIKFFKRFDDIEKTVVTLPGRISHVDKKIDGAIHLSHEAMFVCNKDGLCVLANEALCELFGATPGQMSGRGWGNFIVQEDRERAWKNWEYNMGSGVEDIKDTYRIEHGRSKEIITITYHAIVSRNENDDSQIIVSVGKAYKK